MFAAFASRSLRIVSPSSPVTRLGVPAFRPLDLGEREGLPHLRRIDTCEIVGRPQTFVTPRICEMLPTRLLTLHSAGLPLRPMMAAMAANTVGVREVARLISRIRHRQFGVLVTTSLIARQAYEEVRDDRHPIVFICGRDIAEILIQAGYGTVHRVAELLDEWKA